MNFYYDILLNFNDELISYYEWSNTDNIERIMKIPIIKINDIKPLLEYNSTIKTDISKLIVTDGISTLAIEIINNKVAYLSSLSYEDELSITDLSTKLEYTPSPFIYTTKRSINTELRIHSQLKKQFLTSINQYPNSLLKYIYYCVTNTSSNNIPKVKEYLINNINEYFDEPIVLLIENICKTI